MPEAHRQRYSTVAIILHWALAVLVIANVLIGWQFDDVSRAERRELMGLHQPIGLTILALTVARIVWRLVHKPPPLPDYLKTWERWLSKIVHAGFYVVLIALPLSGWLTVSAHDGARPIDMFGLFQFPVLEPVAGMDDVHDAAEETHHLIAKVIVYVLLPLHVLGALKHQFLDGRDELGRMLPFRTRRPRT